MKGTNETILATQKGWSSKSVNIYAINNGASTITIIMY